MKTTIAHEDGGYTTPARLQINFEIPDTLTSEEQTKINTAMADIISVYQAHRPADSNGKKA